MVSESTRSAAGDMAGIEWGERELHWLRNVSEPVGTYLVSRQPQVVTAGLSRSEASHATWRPGLCIRNLTREVIG